MTCFLVPGGEALCAAHRSASVIGTGMQNLPLQNVQGELVEVSVTGGQPLAATAATDISPRVALMSLTGVTAHGAGATVGAGTASPPPIAAASEAASKPGPLPAP